MSIEEPTIGEVAELGGKDWRRCMAVSRPAVPVRIISLQTPPASGQCCGAAGVSSRPIDETPAPVLNQPPLESRLPKRQHGLP